jgi:DNA-directed RNA polymerases I, II, and III subunit RPABC1
LIKYRKILTMLKEMYSAYLTMIEMLKDREYNVPDHYNDIDFVLFKELYNNDKLDIYLETNIKSIFVKMLFISKIRASKLEFYIKEITKRFSPSVIVFICPFSPTASINNVIKKFPHIQIFHSKKLIINITKHEFVPPHIKISDDKKEILIKKYTLNSFPIIKLNDPVVKYYNFQKGDILRIIRNNLNSGYSEYYRLVA